MREREKYTHTHTHTHTHAHACTHTRTHTHTPLHATLDALKRGSFDWSPRGLGGAVTVSPATRCFKFVGLPMA
jgi:hypothetical protein